MPSLKLATPTALALVAILIALRANVAAPAEALAASPGGDTPEPRIAVCEIVPIIDDLMQSDRFAPERQKQETKLRDEIFKPIFEEGKALEQALGDADPDDPANAERKKRLIELREIILPQAEREFGVRQEKLFSGQIIEAYSMVTLAARDVATELGFNYLLASESSTRALDDLREAPMAAVKQAILSRPAIMYPDAVDISDDVRDDLKID